MRFFNLFFALAASLTVSANAEGGDIVDLALERRGSHEVHHRHHDRKRTRRRRHRQRGACKAKANRLVAPTATSEHIVAAATVALDTTTPVPVPTQWSQTVGPAAVQTWTSSAQQTGTNTGTTSGSLSSLTAQGITGFLKQNVGIGSWFKTNSGQDSTNGKSWCDTPYQDDWLGFAPDVSIMLNNFGGDRNKAGPAYCGLEARATNPANGKTALIYIVDGFDPAWIRVPGSIDLTLGAFQALYGSTTNDKNVVIQNLQWELTGNRRQQYSYGAGRNW